VAWLSVGLVCALFVFFALIVSSVRRYKVYQRYEPNWNEEDAP